MTIARVAINGLRVAYFIGMGSLRPTPETVAALQRAVTLLEQAGCSSRSFDIPDADAIYETYTGLMWSDGGAGIARILAKWGTTESPLFDRIRLAVAEPSGAVTERFERWDRWRSRMLALFANFDVMICPAYVGPAPLHGAFERPSAAYTQAFDLTGWPSTVIRAGTSPEGLPIGIQCVAHAWREDISLAVARQLEQVRFGPWPGPRLA